MSKHLSLASALLLACATLTTPAVAQDAPDAPAKTKKVKARNEVLKDAFKDVATAQRKFTVQIKAGDKALGFGVVLENGEVLTTTHVLGRNSKVELVGPDFSGEATLVGRERSNHLALLKIKGDAPAGTTLADSGKLFIGQFVVSVGISDRPLAAGCVSAVNRSVTAKPQSPGGGNLLAELFGGGGQKQGPAHSWGSIIQHDSKIKDAHIGSPVYNAEGELVGLNAEIAYRGSSYFVGSTIIGKTLVILRKGHGMKDWKPERKPRKRPSKSKPKPQAKSQRGFLGVAVEGVTPKNGEAAFAVKVTEVRAGSAAADAGLKTGDLITSVDGASFEDFDGFVLLMKDRKAGETVRFEVWRGEATKTVEATLGKAK